MASGNAATRDGPRASRVAKGKDLAGCLEGCPEFVDALSGAMQLALGALLDSL
jgi:hypothetical protein